MSGGGNRDLFVLGLDGVPFDLLERWVAAGELPTFAQLFEEGVSGSLRSTTPASTPLAWPSIVTGRWPDSHGSYWFRKLQSDYTHRMTTSADVGCTKAWEILEPATVMNVPMTYPAEPVNGHLVTGMMTPSKGSGFTHPPTFAETIDEQVPEYRIGLDWQEYAGDDERLLEEINGLVSTRRRLLEYLLAETEFRLGFVVFTSPDRLQHLVWDNSILLDHYRVLDAVLELVVSYVEANHMTLFVVSDHGFGPVERTVQPNRILEEAGFLVRRDSRGARGILDRLGIEKDRIKTWLDAVGVAEDAVVERLPQRLVETIASQVPGQNVMYDVDHGASKAFVHGKGSVYLNRTDRFDDGIVRPAEADRVRAELVELFESFTDPMTGEAVLEVFDGSELFPADPHSPDVVLEGTDRYEVGTRLTDEPVVDAGEIVAGHRPEGILLAYGPEIDRGERIEGATVVDVLPTMLHAIDEPVPADRDGEVLRGVFVPGSDAASRDVRERVYHDRRPERTVDEGDPDSGADESVQERLRGLGYID